MQKWFENSLPGRALDRTSDWIVRLFERCFARYGPPRECKSVLLPHEWFLCFGILIMFCVPHRYWNNLYAVVFVGAALVLYWVDCARYGIKPTGPSVLGPGVWLFLVWAMLVTLWAIDPVGHLRVLVFYITGFVLTYVIAGSFKSPEALKRLMGVLYVTLVAVAVYGLYELFSGRYEGNSYYFTADSAHYRVCSTLENSNNLGEFIAMLLPLAYIAALNTQNTRLRCLWFALLLIPFSVILLSFSRTGWLALLAAVLVLAYCLIHRRTYFFLAILGIGLIMSFLLPNGIVSRFLSILQPNADNGRFAIWRDCLQILQHDWLQGIGMGPSSFTSAYEALDLKSLDMIPPHSNMGYLQIFIETGLLGFASFLLFFLYQPWQAGSSLRHITNKIERHTLLGCLASLIGSALAFFPEHIWFYPRCFFCWCMVLGIAIGIHTIQTDNRPQ